MHKKVEPIVNSFRVTKKKKLSLDKEHMDSF